MKKAGPVVIVLLFVLMLSACGINPANRHKEGDTGNPSGQEPAAPAAEVSKKPDATTAGAADSYPPDIQSIADKGKLVVAMYKEDRPPFFYTDAKGNLAGSDVQLAKDIAEAFGVDVEFRRSANTFEEVVNQVVQGDADIAVSKLSITLDRAKKLLYTEPYLVLKQALLINRVQLAALKETERDALQIANHSGRKIGVKYGTSYIDFSKHDFPNAELVVYRDQTAMMRDLLEGKLLAVFYDENELKKYIYENPERSIALQLSMLSGKEDRLAIGVRSGNRQLQEWLNVYLKMNKVNADLDQLLRKYIRSGDYHAG